MPILTPDYTRYPNAEEVELMLVGANVWPQDETQIEAAQFQAEAAVAGAINEFEMRTGWFPFLKDSEATTRYFDATDTNGYLDLQGGLYSLTSATVGGSARTLNTNLFLRPSNALYRRMPYTQIEFYGGGAGGGSIYPTPNSIAITGIWGRVETVPADVWQAILQKAAHTVMLATNQEQDVVSRSEDGFSESYDQVGIIDPKLLNVEWPKAFESAVRRWTRVVC